jgi:hypothetical protein
MNIFFLDKNPRKCAEYYMDRHMKILLEIAQLLCTAYHRNGYDGDMPYRELDKRMNIRVQRWVYENSENFKFALRLGWCIFAEHYYRYGNEHSCGRILEWVEEHPLELPDGKLYFLTQSGYEKLEPIKSNRQYMIECKRHLAVWTKRETPHWWK